jgi:hypothetical protein
MYTPDRDRLRPAGGPPGNRLQCPVDSGLP